MVFFLLCFFIVCSTGFLVHRFARKRVISRGSLSPRLDQIEEILIRITKADEERRKADEERRKADEERREVDRKENEEEHRKMRRSLNELIGYNQNVDRSLEVSMAFSFKSYLVNKLKIPESCIRECDVHIIFDPLTGDVAVEWDGIFVIDYSDVLNENNGTLIFQLPESWPAHHTVFLLEVKQLLNTTSVFEKLPKRVSKTIISLTSQPESAKSKVRSTIAVQKARFPENPIFVVAVGGKNINNEIEEQILERGYLAIRPSGDDFNVVESPSSIIEEMKV